MTLSPPLHILHDLVWHSLFLNGFDFTRDFLIVNPDLSITFTFNPACLNSLLQDSANSPSGVASTNNTASDPSFRNQFARFRFFVDLRSFLSQSLFLYIGTLPIALSLTPLSYLFLALVYTSALSLLEYPEY